MAIVGSAEVIIRAITSGVGRDIHKALQDALPGIKVEGYRAGKEYADAFSRGMGQTLSKNMQSALDSVDWRKSGAAAGDDFGTAAGKEIEKDVTTSVERTNNEIVKTMGGGGRRGGSIFGIEFSKSFKSKAISAAKQFNALWIKSAFAGPAIATLVGGLSSLVSGLFALGSAAAQATPALAVLPGSISAIAQAGIVAKISLKGVGGLSQAYTQLRDAQAQFGAGSPQAAAALNRVNKELAHVSPEAASFARQLSETVPVIDEFRQAVGKDMFPALEVGLYNFTHTLLPGVQDGLTETGNIAGELGRQFIGTVTSGEGMARLNDIISGNNDILKVFTTTNESGNSAISDMVILFERLLVAIQPVTMRFAEWIATLLNTGEAATQGEAGMTRLTDFFSHAGDVAAQLGRIFGNLAGAIFDLGSVAGDSGQSLLDSFEAATVKLREMIDQGTKTGELKDFFAGAAENTKKIASFVGDLSLALLGLGDNKAIGETAGILSHLVAIFSGVGDTLISVGPSLGAFAEQVGRIIAALTDSGSLVIFFNVLTFIFRIIANLLEQPVVQWALGIAAGFFAVSRAISFATKPFSFLGRAAAGSILGVVGNVTKLKGALATLRTDGPAAAFRSLTLSSDGVVAAFEAQMVVDKAKVTSLNNVGAAGGRAAAELGTASAAGAGAAVARPGAAVAPTVARTGPLPPVPPAVAGSAARAAAPLAAVGSSAGAAAGGVSKLGSAFRFLMGPLGIILLFLPLLLPLFQKLLENEAVQAVLQKLGEAFAQIGSVILTAVIPIFQALMPVITTIINLFLEHLLPAILSLLPVFVQIFGLIATVIAAVIPVLTPILELIIGLFTDLLIPVIEALLPIFTSVFGVIINIISGLFSFITPIIAFIADLFTSVLVPAIQGVLSVVQFVFGLIGDIIGVVFGAIADVYHAVLEPIFDALVGAFTWVGDQFQKLADVFQAIWDAIIEIFKAPINFVIEIINDWLLKPLNTVTSIFGLEIPLIQTLADGGPVRGKGGGRDDRNLAALSHGEYVLNAKRTRQAGMQNVDAFNKGRSNVLEVASNNRRRGSSGGGVSTTGGWDIPVSPKGGFFDFIGDAFDAIGDAIGAVGGFLGDLLKQGVGIAVGGLMDIFFGDLLDSPEMQGGNFITNFIIKILQKFRETMDEWARGADEALQAEEQRRSVADKAIGSDAFYGTSAGWPAPQLGVVATNTAAAVAFVKVTWPEITSIGTLGSRPNPSDHPYGKALDTMISSYASQTGIALGNAIADYFIKHPNQFGTKYVIWRDKINQSGGRGWQQYTHPTGGTSDTLRHLDHVHISLYDSGGILKSGSLGVNLSGGAERVLTPDQTKSFDRLVHFLTGNAFNPNRYGIFNEEDRGLSRRDIQLVDRLLQNGALGGGSPSVRVFIGDTELNDFIHTTVDYRQDLLASAIANGRKP